MQVVFREIHVDDITLAYIEQGRGAPVILLHGGGPTDLRTWGQQMDPFAESFRVIAYSRRYHYPNPWTGDGSDINSAYVHAGDLFALIASLQLGPVHLIGFSYGADIALRLAVEHPELIRTLVVTEPALFSWLITLPGGSELFTEYADTIIPAKRAVQNGNLEGGLRLFIDGVMGSGVYEQLPTSARERLLDNARLLSAELTDMSEIVTDITPDEAATIQAPTLILTGDESPKMFLLISQELAHYLPNAGQAQISGASHILHVLNPQAYNAAVLAFLAKHSG